MSDNIDHKVGFIGNYDLLEENHEIEDLLDYSYSINSFSKKLNSLKKNSMVGLIGKFGCGKSTMLHQMKTHHNSNSLWIEFDAWKYPERKDLWEGFILDVADQLGNLKNIKDIIEGKSSASNIADVVDRINTSFSVVPGLNILVELFKKVFEKSPATRVFELQEILSQLLIKTNKEIIFIVEDIDRSGDYGIYFLETLKQFIKKINSKNLLKVIVPVGDIKFDEKKDYYLKCFDITEEFNPSNIKFDTFVNELFDESLFDDNYVYPNNNSIKYTGSARKDSIISFLNEFVESNKSITVRVLKHIIRKANINYINIEQKGFKPDFRISILIEASRYIIRGSTTIYKSIFDSKDIPRDTLFWYFLICILYDNDTISDRSQWTQSINSYKFKFVTPESNEELIHLPYKKIGHNEEITVFLSDVYLDI